MAGFIKRTAKGTGKTLGDWMGLSVTVGVARMMGNIIVAVFMPWKAGPKGEPETFEQAIKRLRLSEEDIVARRRMFVQQAIFFTLVGFAIIAYGVSLAFSQAIVGMLMTFLVSLIAFVNAFRSHFWYFQMKQRKLGCTLQEWLNGSLEGATHE
jgi:intracellular multiplication protein IcmV